MNTNWDQVVKIIYIFLFSMKESCKILDNLVNGDAPAMNEDLIRDIYVKFNELVASNRIL